MPLPRDLEDNGPGEEVERNRDGSNRPSKRESVTKKLVEQGKHEYQNGSLAEKFGGAGDDRRLGRGSHGAKCISCSKLYNQLSSGSQHSRYCFGRCRTASKSVRSFGSM